MALPLRDSGPYETLLRNNSQLSCFHSHNVSVTADNDGESDDTDDGNHDDDNNDDNDEHTDDNFPTQQLTSFMTATGKGECDQQSSWR